MDQQDNPPPNLAALRREAAVLSAFLESAGHGEYRREMREKYDRIVDTIIGDVPEDARQVMEREQAIGEARQLRDMMRWFEEYQTTINAALAEQTEITTPD